MNKPDAPHQAIPFPATGPEDDGLRLLAPCAVCGRLLDAAELLWNQGGGGGSPLCPPCLAELASCGCED